MGFREGFSEEATQAALGSTPESSSSRGGKGRGVSGIESHVMEERQVGRWGPL